MGVPAYIGPSSACEVRLRLKDFLYYSIATGFGSGFSPVVPGTVGSAVATVLVWLFWPAGWFWQALICVLTTLIAIKAAGWLAESIGQEDPSLVVADEFSGQFFTFLGLGAAALGDWRVLLLGFVLFRVFDILKPGPVGRLENLPGGWGIVMDDVLAGIFANILLRVAMIWM